MKVFIGYLLISLFLFSILFSYIGNFPAIDASPRPLGILPLFALWIWMFIDFFKRKNINNKLRWGLCLFFFHWIAAIVYFRVIFQKSEGNIPIFVIFEKNSPKTYKFLKMGTLALVLTTIQLLLTSTIYKTFGFPFNSAYEFIVYKVIYFPHSSFLKAFYSIANIDTNAEISSGIGLLITGSDIIYTSLLYFIALVLYYKIKDYRCRN